MAKKVKKKKPPPEEQQELLAAVRSLTVSYYMRGNIHRFVDEAITDVLCEIVKMEGAPQHIGKEITCSLMCSREYVQVPNEERPSLRANYQTMPQMPFMMSMVIGKEGGIFSAYLPEAVYWALQTDLKSGRLKFIQATFSKLKRGHGDLHSIYFSETEPEELS